MVPAVRDEGNFYVLRMKGAGAAEDQLPAADERVRGT